MRGYKTNIKFKEKELKKFIDFIEGWIEYRGGMSNRIDAGDIRIYLYKLLNKLIKNKPEDGK